MSGALSFDLRSRVIAAVEAGSSRRAAAVRFGVSVSSAIRRIQAWRESGRGRACCQSGDRRSQRAEAYKDTILAAVNAKNAVRLAAHGAKSATRRRRHCETRVVAARCGAAGLALLVLCACREENRLVAPAPPRIGVAAPGQQVVTPYLEATGTTAAVNSADLVARVAGTLVSIGYRDGDTVKQGQVLFSIDPTEYRAKLQQAQAAQANSQAQLVSAEADLQRQATLGRENWSSQSTIDQARSLRDGLRATVAGQQAGITLAQLDLDYTSVVAPFEGVVSARLLSPGSLVGLGGPTKLATITQLKPIYITFTISEQDALRVRAQMQARGVTLRTLDKVTVEAGLMTEEGYPHRGTLDYAAPQFDTGSGTITLRAMFGNADAALIPGGFARIRLPAGPPRTALVVPDEALGADQGGRYLLVLDKSNVVQQRRVRPGPKADSGMRVIDAGLDSADRVVVSRLQRAVPGTTVVPETVPITVARNGPGVTADAGAGGSGRR